MKSIIKTGKRSIIAILTLCILLDIAGTGLNYYIGKNNWSYGANGSPQANGFNIYVNMSTGYCRVTGDNVNNSFYFGKK